MKVEPEGPATVVWVGLTEREVTLLRKNLVLADERIEQEKENLPNTWRFGDDLFNQLDQYATDTEEAN